MEKTSKLKEYKKLNESKYNKKQKISIINITTFFFILLCISIVVNVWQFTNFVGFLNFWDVFFIDKDVKFQWAGITAVIAIISLSTTVLITVNKNKADLVSKSRIEWLQNAKELTSKYLSAFYKHQYEAISYYELKSNKSKNTELINEKFKAMNEAMEEILSINFLLIINFSENLDHEEILNCIGDVKNYALDIKQMYDEKIPINMIVAENLVKSSRAYYKREWNKA